MAVAAESLAKFLNVQCTDQLQAQLEIARQLVNNAVEKAKLKVGSDKANEVYNENIKDSLTKLIGAHIWTTVSQHHNITTSGIVTRQKVGESETYYADKASSMSTTSSASRLDSSGYGILALALDPLNLIHETTKNTYEASIQVITPRRN